MEVKQIDVRCPCCSTLLTIDVLTRKVLRTAQPEEVDETGKTVLDEGRWDDANKRVEDRKDEARDKLDAALDYERGKENHLDDLFDKAKKKLEGGDDDD